MRHAFALGVPNKHPTPVISQGEELRAEDKYLSQGGLKWIHQACNLQSALA